MPPPNSSSSPSWPGSLTLNQDEIFGTIRINRVEGAEAYVPGEGPELTE